MFKKLTDNQSYELCHMTQNRVHGGFSGPTYAMKNRLIAKGAVVQDHNSLVRLTPYGQFLINEDRKRGDRIKAENESRAEKIRQETKPSEVLEWRLEDAQRRAVNALETLQKEVEDLLDRVKEGKFSAYGEHARQMGEWAAIASTRTANANALWEALQVAKEYGGVYE